MESRSTPSMTCFHCWAVTSPGSKRAWKCCAMASAARSWSRLPRCSEALHPPELLQSERKTLEDSFWNRLHHDHDVAPDSGRVEDVGRAPLEPTDDVSGDLTRVGEAHGVWQMIGHRRPHLSGLDGDHADACRVEPAAKALEEERKTALG